MNAEGKPDQLSASLQAGTIAGSVQAECLDANLSAIASAKTGTLNATGDAIGIAQVEGDSATSMSVVGVATAKGSSSITQSYVSAFVASDQMSVRQAGAAALVARTVTFEQAGAAVAVAGDASVRRSFIGILLAGDADIAEDSRVLLNGRALLLLSLVVLGGFGIVAVAMVYSARRISTWRPVLSLPKWSRHRRA